MKGKIITTIIAAMLSYTFCIANTVLHVNLVDGTEIICSLDDEPQMSFGDKTIVLSSLNGTIGEWSFTDVDSWSFATVDAINDIKVDNSQIRIEGDHLSIKGNNPKNAGIYDITGKQVIRHIECLNGVTTISLTGLIKGTYMLKTDKNCIKFIVK